MTEASPCQSASITCRMEVALGLEVSIARVVHDTSMGECNRQHTTLDNARALHFAIYSWRWWRDWVAHWWHVDVWGDIACRLSATEGSRPRNLGYQARGRRPPAVDQGVVQILASRLPMALAVVLLLHHLPHHLRHHGIPRLPQGLAPEHLRGVLPRVELSMARTCASHHGPEERSQGQSSGRTAGSGAHSLPIETTAMI